MTTKQMENTRKAARNLVATLDEGYSLESIAKEVADTRSPYLALAVAVELANKLSFFSADYDEYRRLVGVNE